MIGFNELGRKGNLGNQMFQFAALRGVSSHKNYSFQFPPNDRTRIHDYSLFKLFDLKSVSKKNIGYVPFDTYKSPSSIDDDSVGFEFDQFFFENCPDNVNINGFFQSEKYFVDIKEDLKKDFSFKKKHLKHIERYKSELDQEFIAIHIRRGDYLKFPLHHPVLRDKYYATALELMPNWQIVIFTDDKSCINEFEFLKNRRYVVSNFADSGHDLALMSTASALVTANSSFSWWGAWLSESKTICAPKNWFGPELSHLNTKDLLPDSWNVID